MRLYRTHLADGTPVKYTTDGFVIVGGSGFQIEALANPKDRERISEMMRWERAKSPSFFNHADYHRGL